MSRLSLCLLLCAFAATARADQVHLKNGAVIEGKATRAGERVVVAVEGGEMAVAADDVVKIEAGQSPLQRVEQQRAALAGGDVKGRIALADYCRDHDLRALERELLQEVIERAPDHANARARLDYVRTPTGWLKREDQLRAQGLVEYEGRWVPPEQALALEKLRTEAAVAQSAREQARAELEAKKLELARAEEAERRDTEAARAENAEPAQPITGYYYPYYPAYADGWPRARVHRDCSRGRCRPPARKPKPDDGRPIFPPGTRDPFDYLR